MNGLPYYKRYPRDFFEGTIGMPLELKGPYSLIIDLIYMQNGNLPDDARYISGLLGCSLRQWTSLRERLLGMGKITQRDGYLTNYRADNELITSHLYQNKQRENGAKGGKIKGLRQAVAKPKPSQPESEPETVKERTPEGVQKKIDIVLSTLCHEATEGAVVSFMAYRRKSKAGALTETAAKRLAKHLRAIFDAGGDTDDALAMAEERGWRTVEPEWYFRERAGNGNGNHNANGSGRNGSSAHDKLMAGFAAVADREQRKAGLDLFPGEGPEFPGEPDSDSWQGGRLA